MERKERLIRYDSFRDPWFYGRAGRFAQASLVLRSFCTGQLSRLGGSVVSLFEEAVSSLTGSPNAVAVASGTSAFELILDELQIGIGDEVLIPAFGWASIPGAVYYRGGIPRIVDTDLGFHSSWQAYQDRLTSASRALVVVHMRGFPHPCLADIIEKAETNGIAVIEDCAQAWGSRVSSRHVGTFGSFGFLSTNQHKLVAAGEGGVVIGHDSNVMEHIRWAAGGPGGTCKPGSWPRNLRMPELTAALALPQVVKVEHTIARLRWLQARVYDRIAGSAVSLGPREAIGTTSNGITTALWCSSEDDASKVVAALVKNGLAAFRPGQVSDLHNASSWPVPVADDRKLPGLAALANYVDLPTPLTRRYATKAFLRHLDRATAALWDIDWRNDV